MVKNWADQSSDDEEDARERHVMLDQDMEALQQQPHRPEATDYADYDDHDAPAPSKERTYEFPNEPPYTAYIGNVAYTVTDPAELADAMVALAKEHLNLDIVVTNPRIAIDRRETPPKPRGFGYVTVETLDQLKRLMELNDKDIKLANRNIQVNVAAQHRGQDKQQHQQRSGGGGGNYRDRNDHRRSSETHDAPKWDRNQKQSARTDRHDDAAADAAVDGSKFRGGRYQHKREPQAPNDSVAVDAAPPAGPRPQLKLLPRTKPVESTVSGGSQSTLFGGAKPRDESSWQKKHLDEGSGRGRGNSARGDGGRGTGRGDGRGGRSEGRGEVSRSSGGQGGARSGRGEGRGGRGRDGADRKPASSEKPKREPRVTQPKVASESKQAEAEPEKKKEVVTNKFAALGFDSDSD
ncbi:hypothetical protein MPSEU_000959000 [Mayamaea pseudoterrestris]|nr:hypothetical protein MPSEU_000959000 [Mayamaea pseudoterrestris]